MTSKQQSLTVPRGPDWPPTLLAQSLQRFFQLRITCYSCVNVSWQTMCYKNSDAQKKRKKLGNKSTPRDKTMCFVGIIMCHREATDHARIQAALVSPPRKAPPRRCQTLLPLRSPRHCPSQGARTSDTQGARTYLRCARRWARVTCLATCVRV